MNIASTGLSVQYLAFNSFNPLNFCPFPTILPEAQQEYILNMNDWLFPESEQTTYTHAWTTSAHVDLPFVAHIALSEDETLGVHAIDKRTAHPIVSAPSSVSPEDKTGGKRETNVAWEAFYPAGSINPSGPIPGGLGFYMRGPKVFEEGLKDAKEVRIGYSVMFERGWEWVLGGKLPGACT